MPPLISFPLASWLPPLLKAGFGDSQRSKHIFRSQAPTWRHRLLRSASERACSPELGSSAHTPARTRTVAGYTADLDHSERSNHRKQPKSKPKCEAASGTRPCAPGSYLSATPQKKNSHESATQEGHACTCPWRDQLRPWPSIHSLPSSSAKVRLS